MIAQFFIRTKALKIGNKYNENGYNQIVKSRKESKRFCHMVSA